MDCTALCLIHSGWKNSIRHNLSLHDLFVREVSNGSKASYWTLRPDLNVRPLTLDSVVCKAQLVVAKILVFLNTCSRRARLRRKALFGLFSRLGKIKSRFCRDFLIVPDRTFCYQFRFCRYAVDRFLIALSKCAAHSEPGIITYSPCRYV